jgi:hypothetical protein
MDKEGKVMEYDNEKRGVMFVNDNKQTDQHPDLKGSVTVEGVEYWLSGFWKTPKKGGEDFLSVSLQRKTGQGESASTQRQAPARGRGRPQNSSADDDMSDVPF